MRVTLILACVLELLLVSSAKCEIIPLKSIGGVYMLPVRVNDTITLNFILDSGASDVTIPADVASTLLRTGTLSQGDFRGAATYALANGSTEHNYKVVLAKLQIGTLTLTNVTASITSANGSLLLGQSFLSRLKSWSLDNSRHTLAINEAPAPLTTRVSRNPHNTHGPVNVTEEFRQFIQTKISSELRNYGFASVEPSYKMTATADLNEDGILDFIILNTSPVACGSGGCGYEIYVGNGSGKWSEIDAPALFGVSSVFIREARGAWSTIFTSEGGQLNSYPIYSKNVYNRKKNAYVEIASRFCGGLDFDFCTKPVIFCPIHDTKIDIKPEVKVFRAPYNEPIALAGSGDQVHKARVPLSAPKEPSWVKGQSLDGRWFMVMYKFSGARYVKRRDMTGPLPKSPVSCVK